MRVNSKAIGWHLLFWMAYLLFEGSDLGAPSVDAISFNLDIQYITTIPITVAVCYINLYRLMPLFYERQKFINYTVAVILTVITGAILVRFCAYVIWHPWDRTHFPERYQLDTGHFWVTIRILKNAIKIFAIVAVTGFIRIAFRAYAHEKNLKEMELQKISSELDYLKAQINPHFFFNTLNSLYALTINTSAAATALLLRLSDLMSYMLYKTSAAFVPLKDEITYLENYIGIEQMRFAERLEISFQFSGDIEEKMIAPLLLLPFVENAFKHGIADGSGWITINLKVVDHALTLKVSNSYLKVKGLGTPGLGIANARRRLDLTYAGKYELQLNRHEEFFEAYLRIEI